jgi:4-amino-4-deoxy-L-arabinose transferase-like glycosyltransferase
MAHSSTPLANADTVRGAGFFRTRPWLYPLLALLLVACAVGMMATASRQKSAAFDEQYHLTAGYSYLRTGDYRLATSHPPLVGWLAGVALLPLGDLALPLEDPQWQAANRYEFSDLFLWRANPNPVEILEHGRWAVMALSVLLLAGVALWSRALFAAPVALAVVALAAFDPNLLANGRVITTDLGVTCFLFLAVGAAWGWLESRRWGWAVAAGLAAGLAMAAKYTGLMIWPILGLLLLLYPWPQQRRGAELVRRLGALVLLGLLALLLLAAVYKFDTGVVAGAPVAWPLPAPYYWQNLLATLTVYTDPATVTPTFLLGQYSGDGWWYYFPVALAVKTPLLTLGLGLGLTGLLTIGYRHLLPAIPFLLLLAGVALQRLLAGPRRLAWATAGAVTLHVLVIALAWPHHDGYFNLAARLWREPSAILVDANFDWGQDLPALARIMAEQGIERVNLAYFGKAAPEAYGVAYHPLPGYLRFMNGRELNAFNPAAPEPGWYAISATTLRMGTLQPESIDLYAWFRSRTPDLRAGSIFLYQVIDPPETPVTRTVFYGDPVAGRPVSELTGANGARVQAKWSQSTETVIDPLGATFTPPPGYQAVGIPFAATPGDEPIFTLAGVILPEAGRAERPAAPGSTLDLLLVWRRGEGAMPMPAPTLGSPLSAFVHLVQADPGHKFAEYDSWETALRGLEPGDLLIQHVPLSLPPETPAGEYRLLAGLYSPQNGQRLVTEQGDAGAAGVVWVGE